MMNYIMPRLPVFLAIKEKDYIDIFKDYEEFFSNFSILFDLLRELGWILIKGLLSITSLMNTLVNTVFDFVNFLDSPEVVQFVESIEPLIWVVFLVALIYLGFCYLVAHKKPEGVVSNLLIFIGVILIVPYLLTQMTQVTTDVKDLLLHDTEDAKYELLIPYITDLVYLDSIDFDKEKIKNGELNGFTSKNSENIKYIDINTVVDPGDFELKNEKLFKKQVDTKIEDGKDTLSVVDIKKDKFFSKDVTPYYYRYHVNFFIAMLYLLALIIVLAFSSFKLVQLIYELTAEKILTPFIAAGDLTGGQKIRKALIGMLNCYITIICVLFLQRLFILATEYINQKTWVDNAVGNGFVKTVMILAGALFIVDGPNFFEQIFGVDAGLKSVGQALQSAYYGSQMLGGAARGVGGMASKLGGAAKGLAGMPFKAAKAAGKGAVNTSSAVAGALGALSGMKETGAFSSNNEKVSQEMAGSPITSQDDNVATEGVSGGLSAGMNVDSSNNNTAVQNEMSMGAKTQTNKATGGTVGSGRNNLASTTGKENIQNTSVNSAINDALNNATTTASASQSTQAVKDNETLSGLAKQTALNSSVGKKLQSSYSKGKTLGRATGNTINHHKKPQGVIDSQNRDNLKK